jgi:predicted ATPase
LPFIGREADKAAIGALLREGKRLVTIWGPGGMGKTRLAHEIALALPSLVAWGKPTARGSWASGGSGKAPAAWACDLTEAAGPDDVCSLLAQAIGARGPALAVLGRALESRGEALLLLDGFERVVGSAGLLAELLSLSPGTRFLVTSRERLGVAGEVSHELGPLAVPDEGGPLLEAGAVALLVSLLQAREPGFAPTDELAPRLAEVVRKLEGIPLAIELAASRAEVLGIEGLLARMPARLDLLGGGRGGPRQRTMRGAIAWSWGMLSPPEQRALARCSVFRGGFTFDAAAAVLGEVRAARSDRSAQPDHRGDADVLDLLQSLRDKSMLRRTGGERVRLSLFETVRDFAAERLAELPPARPSGPADRDDAAERHLAYFRALCEQGGQQFPMATASAERDNLLAALERALAIRSANAALALALGLEPLLAASGPASLHLELLDRTLSLAEKVAERPLAQAADRAPEQAEEQMRSARQQRARAHAARARALAARGRQREALADVEAALSLARASGDPALEAAVLTDAGVLHHNRRDMAVARGYYEQALALSERASEQAGDPRLRGRLLGNLGALCHDARDLAAARQRYLRALALFREAGDESLEGIFLANLGLLEQESGDQLEARTRMERALSLCERSGDERLLAIALSNLGALLHELGELDQALACHSRALGLLTRAGDLRSEALCLARLGAVSAQLGRLPEARGHLDEAEARVSLLDDPVAVETVAVHRAFLLLALARRERGAGRAADAERLSAAAHAAFSAASGGHGAELSDDIRTALRVLAPSLDRAPGSAPAMPPHALVVGPEASWFRAPHAEPQDLRTRRPLRALLAHLCEQHRARPGEPASLEALREVGWPGERMAPEAAANRVQVAVADLRKRGLRALLRRDGGGYLLEPSVSLLSVSLSWADVMG